MANNDFLYLLQKSPLKARKCTELQGMASLISVMIGVILMDSVSNKILWGLVSCLVYLVYLFFLPCRPVAEIYRESNLLFQLVIQTRYRGFVVAGVHELNELGLEYAMEVTVKSADEFEQEKMCVKWVMGLVIAGIFLC